MTRPVGDHRSAEGIIRANSTLSSFLNGPPSRETLEHLKKQVGDWTPDNPDFDSRADAAFSLAKVTNYVDHLNDRRVGNSDQNGVTDGFTYDAELRHGVAQFRSEASLIEEFGEKGYAVFENLGN
ncbi:hypothetical protein GIR22_03350 [Pseudomonas sp. CCM 7891]|uniref:Uncharacterized protein n=2 Tax=Pseudomonas karstica TaxID=1055468 RepID=A0A7X2UXM1_9PSED|nr:hypothetical protein [Pseudomonas karstica]